MNTTEYIKNACKTESNDFSQIGARISDEGTIRLMHGAIGLTTEAGEFIDALKKHVFYGKELDRVNLKEEMGDMFWYLAIIADELDVDFSEIMNTNIKKLKARYGEKFSDQSAEVRDLKKERTILEQ